MSGYCHSLREGGNGGARRPDRRRPEPDRARRLRRRLLPRRARTPGPEPAARGQAQRHGPGGAAGTHRQPCSRSGCRSRTGSAGTRRSARSRSSPRSSGLGLPRTGSTALVVPPRRGSRARVRCGCGSRARPRRHRRRSSDPIPGSRWPRCRSSSSGCSRRAAPRSCRRPPTGPMECQELMALDFKSQIFLVYAYLPSYSNWFLYDADLTSDVPVRTARVAAPPVGHARASRGGSSARRTCCSSTPSTGRSPTPGS